MDKDKFHQLNELVPVGWFFSVAHHETMSRNFEEFTACKVQERNEWTFFGLSFLSDPVTKKRREVALGAATFEALVETVKATNW